MTSGLVNVTFSIINPAAYNVNILQYPKTGIPLPSQKIQTILLGKGYSIK
jgi:hypothetical protein